MFHLLFLFSSLESTVFSEELMNPCSLSNICYGSALHRRDAPVNKRGWEGEELILQEKKKQLIMSEQFMGLEMEMQWEECRRVGRGSVCYGRP